MLSIKIEIGFDKDHAKKKKEPNLKKAALLAALLDSVVWIADTALLLKCFDVIPLCPFGIFLLFGVFLIYLIYFFMKTRLMTKKYGKEVYRKEFGHTGILLAAVSAVMMLFLIRTS